MIYSFVITEEIDYKTSMNLFNRIDNTLELLNQAIAELEWQTLANRSIVPLKMYMHFIELRLKLRNEWCTKLMNFENHGVAVNEKLLHFLCKGPKYTDEIARYGKYLIIKVENLLKEEDL